MHAYECRGCYGVRQMLQELCLATLIHRDTDEGASWARLFEHAAHVRASEPLSACFQRCLHLLKFAYQIIRGQVQAIA